MTNPATAQTIRSALTGTPLSIPETTEAALTAVWDEHTALVERHQAQTGPGFGPALEAAIAAGGNLITPEVATAVIASNTARTVRDFLTRRRDAEMTRILTEHAPAIFTAWKSTLDTLETEVLAPVRELGVEFSPAALKAAQGYHPTQAEQLERAAQLVDSLPRILRAWELLAGHAEGLSLPQRAHAVLVFTDLPSAALANMNPADEDVTRILERHPLNLATPETFRTRVNAA